MRLIRCDGCGKTIDDPVGIVGNPERYEFFYIHVEANEDADHFDACSWACVADVAMRRATRGLDVAEAVDRG